MINLRIVKAATEEQEIYIEELVSELYQIFPLYLNKQKIKELKKQGVLELKEDEYKGTLDEAFQIMTSLQLIHALLTKAKRRWVLKDRDLFDKNCRKLNDCGLYFPLTSADFHIVNTENKMLM
ncbi:YhcU family protein [Bacillus haynesii]|uniref:YhcU family protein n=1 Tax=Bacillus haynesii TaxID=1925021 RepID=A0AA90FA74_9BACI|nr:YhcU family protein [Bacillus haynesii]EWH22339.1 hypothetical protein M769_0108995 [Bacillus haynesii]MCI4129812.1 YhcU family protein [Bacillus haynesii]MCY7753745.1 YhcU family protein [Bacillus haynesii]MCY7771175.1 YhcU family protein [Bacillus haynesii]MCY7791504.1 YhcU family protein [Bacillus haynesii]